LPYCLVVFSVFKWKTECLEESVALFVSVGRGHECDVHTLNAVDLVDVDFREDDLLLNTQCIVTTAVELALDTLEVADTGIILIVLLSP
jgi:hypothetical protein